MRGLRFIILLLIAIPLGWYAYHDSTKGPIDDSPKRDKVFAVEADKIDELEIKSESGDRTTLRRKGSDWEVVQPIAAPADQAAVSGITSNLSSVEIQRVIDENATDLKEFGLAEPRVEVGFKANGKQLRLQLGQKTPSGTDVYAKLGDAKKVFLVPSFLDSTFNHGTFDLRDKSVLKLDREKIDTVEVTAGGRTIRVEKKNGEWQIAEPSLGRAEFGAVDGLVSRVSSVQMKSIVPDSSDLKKYGLDKPAVTVRLGSGSSQATLLVGGPAETGTVYARISHVPRSSRSSRRFLTTSRRTARNTARRISSMRDRSTRRGSRSSATARRPSSKRPRSRTRTARNRRSGARPRQLHGTWTPRKSKGSSRPPLAPGPPASWTAPRRRGWTSQSCR